MVRTRPLLRQHWAGVGVAAGPKGPKTLGIPGDSQADAHTLLRGAWVTVWEKHPEAGDSHADTHTLLRGA